MNKPPLPLTDSQKEAIRRYQEGEKPSITTFIDEETLNYGYGELYGIGVWEFQVPHEFLKQNEPLTGSELIKQIGKENEA